MDESLAPNMATKKTSKKTTIKASPVPAKKPSVTKKAVAQPEIAELLGTRAPSFKLRDQDDQELSSASLAKKQYVLYFYPKDNTPGCTTESCDFRDHVPNFRKLGVTVLGVSPDSTKSHAGFVKKYELPFTLLSDPDKELAQAYGVWALKKNYGKEYWGIVRSTFLIGADGLIKGVWRGVKVKGHVEAVLAAVKA